METNDAVVVLEINPMSKGHAILIPKTHTTLKDFSEAIFSLIHKAIQRINQVLKPQQINITSSETGDHAVINIMPIFGNETGKREKAEPSELEALANELRTEEKHEVKPAKIEKSSKKEKEQVSEPEIIIEKAPTRLP
jgi:diadenosine tetraphosphate (Ap4A) HIT family hydrolase